MRLRVVWSRAIDVATVADWIVAHHEALAAGDARLVKRGVRSVTCHPGPEGRIAVKSYCRAHWEQRLRHWFQPGPATAVWNLARRLEALGLRIPAFLAVAEAPGLLRPGYSYRVNVWVEGAYPVSQWLGFEPGAPSPATGDEAIGAWIVAYSRALALLHRHGLTMPDFRPTNLLFHAADEPPIWLDFDALRFGAGEWRDRLHSLLMLRRSLAPVLTPERCAAVAESYLEALGETDPRLREALSRCLVPPTERPLARWADRLYAQHLHPVVAGPPR